MRCAALVFKEDIFLTTTVVVTYATTKTKRRYTSWAGPEMCGLRARRRATMAFLKRYRAKVFSDGRNPKRFPLKRLFFFSHVRYKKYQIKND